MTIRALVLATLGTLVLAPLVLPASAQNLAVIQERQEAMKAIGKSAKTAGQMLKGEAPFDPVTAAALLATMHASAEKFGGLFPEDSKTGGDTEAAPAIWEKKSEFEAKLAKFDGDITAAIAAKPADLDGFKASFQAVAGNCKGCHQEFRVDK
jgi:cytochrome c556